MLLDRYSPSGVLINENFDILQFRGRTGEYLESPRGEPTSNLLKMASEGLFLELRSALDEAKAGKGPVFRKGVRMRANGVARQVNLEVAPVTVPGARERCFLVLFEDAAPQNAVGAKRDAMAAGMAALQRLFAHFAGSRR